MDYDAVVVGGGMAGLTAAAFLCQAGFKVLVCEKAGKVGGLVNSFNYKGFTFDGGIRAIENSGIVRPMLRQLGLDLPFVSNGVSIGIEKDVVSLKSEDSLKDYLHLLSSQFPENSLDIEKIGAEIRRIMDYMDILYGIDNPLFLDLKKDTKYLYQTILPWLLKYLVTIGKINRLNKPVTEYLKQFSQNDVLIDLIAQHFFKNTPTFFALSYFSLYLDYQYPLGGTGMLPEKMKQYILDHQGYIKTETEICKLDPEYHQIEDTQGHTYSYKQLIWSADLKKLYDVVNFSSISSPKTMKAITRQKNALSGKIGGDSILTLFLTLDLDKSYFAKIANAHMFYTPHKIGLSSLGACPLNDVSKTDLFQWLKQYLIHNTFEISCPAIRDEHLAPPGQTGLIISTLFDYPLAKYIFERGWYAEFKEFSAKCMIDILDETIFPGMKDKVIDQFVSSPLTLEKITGNTDGAITGWSFTNHPIPVIHSMPKVAKSVNTPIPDVFQAGQWVFSPSGLPISILTGKLAAEKVKKQLK